jgi:hypothetical protein
MQKTNSSDDNIFLDTEEWCEDEDRFNLFMVSKHFYPITSGAGNGIGSGNGGGKGWGDLYWLV